MGAEQPNQIHTAGSVAQLLHPLTSREKMLMLMASHPGEIVRGIGARGWAVAGLLASQEEWRHIERKWRYLPAQERNGGFRTWPEAILTVPMAEGRIVAIGCAVSAPAFASIPRDERKRLLWGNLDDPQLLCFRHCVEEGVRRLSSLPAEETLCCLVDCGDAMASTALWFFEDLKNLSDASTRRRLGALGLESKRDFGLLQTADALAKECYERLQVAPEEREEATDSDQPHFHFRILDGTRPLTRPVGSIWR